MENKLKQLQSQARSLEPSASERQELLQRANESVERFLSGINHVPGMAPSSLMEINQGMVVQNNGCRDDKTFTYITNNVMKSGINSSGGDLSYVPLGGLYTSALADFITGGYNKCPTHYFSAPGQVEVEKQLIRWCGDLFGYPSNMSGVFTSGGSMGNLMAVVTARDWFLGTKGVALDKAVVYLTKHTHHCVSKALSIAGLGNITTRFIALDDKLRMDTEALRRAVELDIDLGLEPMMVIGTAGTTDTGAIDPLLDIGLVCQDYDVWFHCDGAYGGFFALVEEAKEKFCGIEMADTIVLDPHKTLFTTFGCSLILVKSESHLRQAFHLDSGNYFLHDVADQELEYNPSDLSLELSRPFRGLKLWLPLMLHGLAPFKAALEEKLILTQYFYREVQKLGFQARQVLKVLN